MERFDFYTRLAFTITLRNLSINATILLLFCFQLDISQLAQIGNNLGFTGSGLSALKAQGDIANLRLMHFAALMVIIGSSLFGLFLRYLHRVKRGDLVGYRGKKMETLIENHRLFTKFHGPE